MEDVGKWHKVLPQWLDWEKGSGGRCLRGLGGKRDAAFPISLPAMADHSPFLRAGYALGGGTPSQSYSRGETDPKTGCSAWRPLWALPHIVSPSRVTTAVKSALCFPRATLPLEAARD